MDYTDILKELGNRTGISGYEKNIACFVRSLFEKLCNDVSIDKFNNVIGKKNGYGRKNKKILITAHIDEIGFIVKSIDDRGFIKISALGGLDSRILPAQEVVIHGKQQLTGVIGAKPPHLITPDEAKKAVKIDDLTVDTGLDAVALKELVSLGDMVTLKPSPVILRNGRMSSKSMDNRCSITAMLVAMEELSGMKHECDIYFAATSQEEFELAGAVVAAYNINPDIAIVVDVCHGDMEGVPKEETCRLGKGPAVGIGPCLDKKYTRAVIEMAKEFNIPYQKVVEPGNTGTEAWAVQVSRAGIPTVLISIPVRYMHTAIETVDMNDVKNAGRLIARFASRIELYEW